MKISLHILCVIGFAVVKAVPWREASDQTVTQLGDGLRYQYVHDPRGALHLVDLWMKQTDILEATKYNAEKSNSYHLFTRANPTTSEPIPVGDRKYLLTTNYRPSKRTIVLIHGWLERVNSIFNTVLVPAFLSAEDVNVIVVDWSAAANNINYAVAVIKTPVSGKAVAKFISWLISVSGAVLSNFHIVGHSLGGHQAGIVGRSLGGQVAYITALDAAGPGWVTNEEKFKPTDGVYTEAIHTNAGFLGYTGTLADVDFYPNGGLNMPGCISQECDHFRSFYYMAESVQTGGFTGTRCFTFVAAMTDHCYLWGILNMGGIEPKTGHEGIYYVRTNSFRPFSRG